MNIIVKMHDRVRVIETTRMDLHSGIMLEDDFPSLEDRIDPIPGPIIPDQRKRRQMPAPVPYRDHAHIMSVSSHALSSIPHHDTAFL